jgi:cyclic beta-1,2-glucan synthetase
MGNGTLHQWIFSGPAGIDPYAFAVSDVYQDLFKEGSFVGKGIYDVDAFEAALAGRIPENAVLSHDLLEGLFVRTALVTDIELFEEFPPHYDVAVSRSHRWARGDWQLLPYIVSGFFSSAKLPFFSRWKMIDNLRRSLSAPATLLALLAAWTRPAASAATWTGFLVATVAFLPALSVAAALIPRRRQLSIRHFLRSVGNDARLAMWHFFLTFTFLPHQASVMTDAIVRVLYRMAISRRGLLEWTSAAQAKDQADLRLPAFYRRMASGPLIAVGASVFLWFATSPDRFFLALPFCLLWWLSPWIARRISLPLLGAGAAPLADEDRRYFRLIARKTWRFFETFVNAANHFLPPDNLQEVPVPVVAHRTSPTNIGLYLLSITAARDFGWIGTLETVERLERTLNTVKNLQRHEGHLYNWYDTADLRPLAPLYVSTVDSGNLAGHLWAVANACRALETRPLFSRDILQGLIDATDLLTASARDVTENRRTEAVTGIQLDQAIKSLREELGAAPSALPEWGTALAGIREKAATILDIARALSEGAPDGSAVEVLEWAQLLMTQAESHVRDFEVFGGTGRLDHDVVRRLGGLAALCEQMVDQMDFSFLFDPIKKIFSIGLQVGARDLDPSYYDLLASEARLASFVAIAKGDVPALHWFRLGRGMRSIEHGLALVSWSGSMFEYLMPSLVMQAPATSLIEKTCRQIVLCQISYGRERGTPWGVSESAYNMQDLEFTYQYSNFGVPSLGLKRGLGDDLLIAPYATSLAAMIEPARAAENFRALSELGAEGRFGFYESLDFTEERLPEGEKVAVVRAYMSHHQGMTLVSLQNVIFEGASRVRFHAQPKVHATELLFQERTPRFVAVARLRRVEGRREIIEPVPAILRRFRTPHGPVPRTHLLSNGRYTVMVTAAGSGYSAWRDTAVTRWKPDTTRDAWGTFVFLRDAGSGRVWSTGFQPAGNAPERYEVDFSEDRAEISRTDGDIDTVYEVVVSPEDDAEIRRVTLRNNGTSVREIDVTSYAEIVLASGAADQAHPAFSNLFISTEYVPAVNALLCVRRPRSPQTPPLWAAHIMVVDGETNGAVQ